MQNIKLAWIFCWGAAYLMQRYKKSSISRGNVPFLGRFPRLIDTFCWWWRTFYWQSCKLGPCWIWKTTWTTFTTCNNLHASRVTILLHSKQQNTTLPLDIPADCPCEALFIVVKVVQVVFPNQQAVLEPIQLLQFVTTYASPWTFLPIVLAKRCS